MEDIKERLVEKFKTIDNPISIIRKSGIVTGLLMIFSVSIDSLLLDFFIVLACMGCLVLEYLKYLVTYEKHGYAESYSIYMWICLSFAWIIIFLS